GLPGGPVPSRRDPRRRPRPRLGLSRPSREGPRTPGDPSTRLRRRRFREREGDAHVTVVQAWLFAGIPALAFALVAFIGRSWWRALLGYAFLAGGFAALVSVDRASAAVFALLVALVYATGRGGRMEGEGFDPTSGSRDLQKA